MKLVNVKNYTSTVPVERTVARIEAALAKAGVTSLVKEYGPRAEVAALKFTIDVGHGHITIRLPVDVDKIASLMLDAAVKPGRVRRPRKAKVAGDFLPQAERTAWKLMQDWVEVQLSLIAMRQADFVAVFLPYLWDGRQTVYQSITSNGALRRLLPLPTSSDDV